MNTVAKLFPALLILLALTGMKEHDPDPAPLSDEEIEEIVTDMIQNEGYKLRCGDAFSVEVIEWGESREIESAGIVFYFAEMEIGLICSSGRITDTGTFSFHIAKTGSRTGEWLFRKVSDRGIDGYQ